MWQVAPLCWFWTVWKLGISLYFWGFFSLYRNLRAFLVHVLENIFFLKNKENKEKRENKFGSQCFENTKNTFL